MDAATAPVRVPASLALLAAAFARASASRAFSASTIAAARRSAARRSAAAGSTDVSLGSSAGAAAYLYVYPYYAQQRAVLRTRTAH